jgi:hypothetical protein
MGFGMETRSVSQLSKLDPAWKAKVTEVLKTMGLINPDFTGAVVIDCNQGGITALTISEKIR